MKSPEMYIFVISYLLLFLELNTSFFPQEIQRRGRTLGHVHIQLDNTCRENKNKWVMTFCSWLVSIGLCKSIRVGFLPVG